MIGFLHGTIVVIRGNRLVISTGHVGYEVTVSPAMLVAHPIAVGDQISLHCHTAVREDDITIYGFMYADYVDWFRKLLSVSGVGASVAMSLLGSLTLTQIARAIEGRDATAFRSVKGVGAKMAERLILDLSGKPLPPHGDALSEGDQVMIDRSRFVVSALFSLGRVVSAENIQSIIRDNPRCSDDEIVRIALNNANSAN